MKDALRVMQKSEYPIIPSFPVKTIRNSCRNSSRILNRQDLECVDLTIPYAEPYRSRAVEMIRSSGKTVIYNGYLMPTAKIPLCTLSPTERAQILMLARDQVDVAYEAGCTWFMQSVGADPGPENRAKAFEALGEYIYELSSYMAKKGNMAFLIELMDRSMHRKSLCGPTDETMEFMRKLRSKGPQCGCSGGSGTYSTDGGDISLCVYRSERFPETCASGQLYPERPFPSAVGRYASSHWHGRRRD